MYPMPTPQIPPYAPATSLFSRGFSPGAAGQLSNIPIQQGVAQSGGFLSKLFSGAQAGGGGLSNIAGMLQNAQKAIGIFQQVSPLVQQYGPLVKQLPAIVSMMRNSGSSNEEENSAPEDVAVKDEIHKNIEKKTKKKTSTNKKEFTIKKKKVSKKKPSPNKNKLARSKKKKPKKEIINGIPAPKLYI
ncbi:hypothetical protein BKP45_05610 [Anaerobacillus alkalidiazotrophicus]|uniref:YqfQ-like protein n=1 Tax=Anaerobacillus alkalidiazotrophicus TaxID=472963 RepID=A0A1S2MBQ9_9BACI|nr:VrrA/YqfQ family protein [Anaerobacillus alkalidiazotrophicus]OIJ22151.1 hypothetical protein BKP45_05610 [Anaerobacillus alkalidiazotrophicus]